MSDHFSDGVDVNAGINECRNICLSCFMRALVDDAQILAELSEEFS